jgi:predicted dehydrogenase
MTGVGQWGRNLLRNFAQAERCAVRAVCDLSDAALQRAGRTVPEARLTTRFEELLSAPDVQAVAIATKAATHYEQALRALQAGKHVYVEKPLTLRHEEARTLHETAEKSGLKLMVGHLMEYHPCVLDLKRMMAAGELGRVYYLYLQRLNLGVVRNDENAWWSLAPHDVSMACFLYDIDPVEVAAQGACYLQPGIEDVVFATLRFPDERLAHIHVSWLDPHKIRKLTVVGTNRMVSFDDMEATEKVRIYDKSASFTEGIENFAQAITIRTGDIRIPKVSTAEPLSLEVKHFVDGVLDDQPIRSDGRDGVRVVRILEAGSRSLSEGGRPIRL